VGTPHPPREAQCELTISTQDDVMSKMGELEPIGLVQVFASPGAKADDPAVKAELRPKACELGGEIIVLTSSRVVHSKLGIPLNEAMAFTVYARKTHAGPQKY
jgi:hypothetical protein